MHEAVQYGLLPERTNAFVNTPFQGIPKALVIDISLPVSAYCAPHLTFYYSYDRLYEIEVGLAGGAEAYVEGQQPEEHHGELAGMHGGIVQQNSGATARLRTAPK